MIGSSPGCPSGLGFCRRKYTNHYNLSTLGSSLSKPVWVPSSVENYTVFEAGDTEIDLAKVMAFEDAEAADRALTVYLTNGATVALKGEEKVQEFVQAIDEHLGLAAE